MRTDEEREKVDKENESDSTTIALFFVGALAGFLLAGSELSALEALAYCAGGGCMFLAAGLMCKHLFLATRQSATKSLGMFYLIVCLAAITLVFWVFNRKVMADVDKCEICSTQIYSSRSPDLPDHICADCLAENLIHGKVGFCESCYDFCDREDMKAGLCTECFSYYEWD